MSTIAVLSPGEMGTQVAKRLLRSGARVITCLAGRSPATATRAEEAGVECLPSLDDVVKQADLVISLVTPFATTPLAREVAAAMERTGRRVPYLEGNSISPSTACEIEGIITAAGGQFVDGGIVGGASELVTDWPALFVRHGFTIVDRRDIIADTMATWDRICAVYEQRSVEAVRRYGHRLARRIRAQIDLVPDILAKYATFPVLSALK